MKLINGYKLYPFIKNKNKEKKMANNCILDNGYDLGCYGVGGVEKVFIGTWDQVKYSFDTTDTELVNGVATGATIVDFYPFEQDAEYAGFDQEAKISKENGTVYFETTLSIKMTNYDEDLRNTVKALVRAPLVAVVKSNNGNWYLLGLESAGRASEAKAGVGTALADLNGSTITFTWMSKNGVYLIDEDGTGNVFKETTGKWNFVEVV